MNILNRAAQIGMLASQLSLPVIALGHAFIRFAEENTTPQDATPAEFGDFCQQIATPIIDAFNPTGEDKDSQEILPLATDATYAALAYIKGRTPAQAPQ